jgi:predicted  nucleic acid-binding Zn-ribbon protein
MALFNSKEFEALQAENAELKEKITSLETRLSDSFSSHKVKKVCQLYDDQIAKFEEEIAALQNRPHNERGAGRKHKATPEQRDYIVSLFSQGVSQHQIARMMTERTGGKWNKTTVRNIIIAAKN